MTTPAQHAATVREGLEEANAAPDGEWLAALDALQAQAEEYMAARDLLVAGNDELLGRLVAAEAERDRLREALTAAEGAYDQEVRACADAEHERDRLKAHVARHREQMDDYERLEAERDRYKAMWDVAIDDAERVAGRGEELKAALRAIAGCDDDYANRIARAALDKEKA